VGSKSDEVSLLLLGAPARLTAQDVPTTRPNLFLLVERLNLIHIPIHRQLKIPLNCLYLC